MFEPLRTQVASTVRASYERLRDKIIQAYPHVIAHVDDSEPGHGGLDILVGLECYGHAWDDDSPLYICFECVRPSKRSLRFPFTAPDEEFLLLEVSSDNQLVTRIGPVFPEIETSTEEEYTRYIQRFAERVTSHLADSEKLMLNIIRRSKLWRDPPD